MDRKKEFTFLTWIVIIFSLAYFMPLENLRFQEAVDATLDLARWYAQEHVILCLLPAFFIAGVISVFSIKRGILITLSDAKSNLHNP